MKCLARLKLPPNHFDDTSNKKDGVALSPLSLLLSFLTGVISSTFVYSSALELTGCSSKSGWSDVITRHSSGSPAVAMNAAIWDDSISSFRMHTEAKDSETVGQ